MHSAISTIQKKQGGGARPGPTIHAGLQARLQDKKYPHFPPPYLFVSQVPSNLKNWLAGSGGDCRTGEGEDGRLGVGQRGHGKAVRGAPKEG